MNGMAIALGDANDLLTEVEDSSVDLIATDPPYEINFANNAWDKPNGLHRDYLAKQIRRVIKPSGNVINFQGGSCDSETKRELDKHFILKNWVI